MNMNQTMPCVPTDLVVIGQRVHCILYGGKDGTVVGITGEQKPQTASSLNGVICLGGGSAHFDIIWDDGTQSPRIPESLLRASVQWRIYTEVVSQKEIADAWVRVAFYKAVARIKADKEKLAYQCAFEKVLKDYSYLNQGGSSDIGDGRFAAKNIRKELKMAWPSVKFSVKSSYDSVYLTWSDGPTKQQVETLIEKYNNGGFDSMQDISTYTPTAFTNAFGGARYLSYSREFSDGLLLKALDALYQRLPENLSTVERPPIEIVQDCQTARIPNLDRTTIGEATRAIASAWDDVSRLYLVQSRHYGLRWIVFSSNDVAQCKPLV